MDFSSVNFENTKFAANQQYEVLVAYEPYVLEPFWIDYKFVVLLPLVFLIWRVVSCFVAHHIRVLNNIEEPPNKCTLATRRKFGYLT